MSDLQKVGPDWGGTGTFKPFTAGFSGGQRVQDAHGRYYDSCARGQIFNAATQAGQTTSAGLATTYVGLCVSNPIASKVNLVVNKVGWAWTVIAAAVNGIGLAIGFSPSANVTHTTPLVPSSSFVGAPTGYAKADTAATLPVAPAYMMFLDNTPAATTNPKGGIIDLEGGIVVPPGGYICTVTTAASSAAAFWASMQWEELPNLI
jgi:hypothetical protein